MPDRKSVVLVTVDSWRADHCGFLGYERDVTPTLDALAPDALVFENAIAPGAVTGSSVPTCLTGSYPNPNREGDEQNYADRVRDHMRSRRTLPQRFANQGYETAAFTASPWASRYYNYDRDFDFFEDFMDGDLSKRFVEDGSTDSVLRTSVVQLLNWWQDQDMFMSWESFYDDVRAWIEDAEEPYFLWLFLVDVHMPYLPPAGFRSGSRLVNYPANVSLFLGKPHLLLESVLREPLVRAYDDMVRYTDEFVHRLHEDLERLDQKPLIAIHADHGEAFGERGVYGHGRGVAEDQFHVPFIVLNGPSDRVTRPFPLRRLPELLPALATDGEYRSYLEPTAWARTYDPAVLIRGETWRYVWRPSEDGVAVRTEDGWEDVSAPELEMLGERIVEGVFEGERERRRIASASEELAATAEL